MHANEKRKKRKKKKKKNQKKKTMFKYILFLFFLFKNISNAVPNVSNDYHSNEMDFLVLYQGQYDVDDENNYSCSLKSMGCKVQTQFIAADFYNSYSTNSTRMEAAGQAVITLYDDGKQYLVDAKTNTCSSYCPLEAGTQMMKTFDIPANAKDNGKVTIDNVDYEEWEWEVDIVGKLSMESVTLLVDINNQDIPYQQITHITPFNNDIGKSWSTYKAFTPGAQDKSLFDVQNKDKCPENPNCSQQNNDSLFAKSIKLQHNKRKQYVILSEMLGNDIHHYNHQVDEMVTSDDVKEIQ